MMFVGERKKQFRRYAKPMALVAALCTLTADRSFAQQDAPDSQEAVKQAWERAKRLERDDEHFEAAGLLFDVYTLDGDLRSRSISKITLDLLEAGFPNAASYFFIRTLQTDNRAAIRQVLEVLPELMEAVGGDLLRAYILRHTKEEDYNREVKNHFFYFLGKDALLKGETDQALSALSKVQGSNLQAQAHYLRGTAFALKGQLNAAYESFRLCERMASRSGWGREDLENRCVASQARVQYEAGNHAKAEEVYDRIPKASFVFTDILFEQAWNEYAQRDLNRALGKLVTYRSPSLNFVFNPEIEVLRAQSFLSVCLYDDVNDTINDFNSRYSGVGAQMKSFLVTNDKDLSAFWQLGRQAFFTKLHAANGLGRIANRFVRGPYFARLVRQERAVIQELNTLRNSKNFKNAGFKEFVDKVLNWRLRSIQQLGGLFVKNSLYDLYQELIGFLDRMSFIKLEMLKFTKTRLEQAVRNKATPDDDGALRKGEAKIDRKDYQYFWSFNGEFWLDELGDYVFALVSECNKP